MTTNHLLTQLPSYNALVSLSENLASQSISKMLDSDPDRAEDFVVSAAGLTLDYSKALLDRPTRDALLELAADSQWQAKV
ncbi:MAG: glucose-6-phosphate isomerase, partial [Halioglobus sp.]